MISQWALAISHTEETNITHGLSCQGLKHLLIDKEMHKNGHCINKNISDMRGVWKIEASK